MAASTTRTIVSHLPNMSALAWETYALCGKRPISLVIVSDESVSENLKNDLLSWDQRLKIYTLNPLETDLLRNRGPSAQTRLDRLRFFSALANIQSSKEDKKNSGSKIFIASAGAFIQKTPPLHFFQENSLVLHRDDDFDRPKTLRFFAELGYKPSEIVENPGSFALRGSVLDVFPPTEEFPVRVEVLDDKVQSMRSFHPESQRKIQDLDLLWLGPSREFRLESDSSDQLAPIKHLIKVQPRKHADREALTQRFEQGSLFPEIDFWGPMLRGEEAAQIHCLLDEIKKFDICIEAQNLEAALVSQSAECDRQLKSHLEEGEWVPNLEYFLNPIHAISEKFRRHLALGKTWLLHKKTSGLNFEPEHKIDTQISSLDILSAKLVQAKHDQASPIDILQEHLLYSKEKHLKTVYLARTTSQLERLSFLFEQRGIYLQRLQGFDPPDPTNESSLAPAILVSEQNHGFEDPTRSVVFIPTDLIFGTTAQHLRKKTLPQKRRSIFGADLGFIDLKPGDFVVHAEHGIGRYLGLRIIDFAGIPTELIEIEYKDNNKLLVPVTRLGLVQKHSMPHDGQVLDKLGGQTWTQKKAKAKKELRSIAGELLHLYSKRELALGPTIDPGEEKIANFAASFPFTETLDQAKAIADCLEDIKGPKPMDRLLCGDVGYGKTEVALRITHAAISAGFQVAVLSPTTLLAVQHEQVFKSRLEKFGIQVRGLSRFKEKKEKLQTFEELKDGKIGVVIGTHALLSNSVSFKNLGLLIVDEEQKFGVTHKEKIKQWRNNVHVLSMSATPIPRTLNMAMSGLKELSIISTPPAQRLSVKTFISKKSDGLIKEAIQNEINRGGQVFYVHNRVQSIHREFEELQKLLPDIQIEYAHGQMEERELEKRVMNFYEGRTQVLLTTSIVESGLDIPNANTLIVDRADTFGLSQLYQLRGRVGRSADRAFAYLMTPDRGKINAQAEQRLAVLEAYQELGSGFHIASHDLDIRGAGDLLGRNQSGNISMLGFDSYVELLKECMAELKGEDFIQVIDPDIQIPLNTSIPENYIPEIGLRLMIYKRLAAALDEHEIDEVTAELEDRFGHAPDSVQNLFALMRIKCQLRRLGVRSAVASKTGVALTFANDTPVDVQKMLASIRKYPTHYHLTPEGKLVIKRPVNAEENTDLVRGVEGALSQLENWCS